MGYSGKCNIETGRFLPSLVHADFHFPVLDVHRPQLARFLKAACHC